MLTIIAVKNVQKMSKNKMTPDITSNDFDIFDSDKESTEYYGGYNMEGIRIIEEVKKGYARNLSNYHMRKKLGKLRVIEEQNRAGQRQGEVDPQKRYKARVARKKKRKTRRK